MDRRVVTPLLATKFHIPRRRRNAVARPRLSTRLGHARDASLVLVSAPAGFGKTTLLTEWLAAEPTEDTAVAWLSLDSQDNDASLFWAYVVAALQHARPELAVTVDGAGEQLLPTLLNEITAVDGDIVLVLDDYHLIESRDIQNGMEFLVEHLPPNLHVVIGTRADPTLPLPRLRARGDLVEIRAADLRFTTDEAAAYLNAMVDADISSSDIATLEARTEGWIAALQLAALSMQGRDNISEFVASFAGDDRFVVDYLAGEVLHQLPKPVRTFLLHTSILGRLSGPLCDAVTGRDDSATLLRELDDSNLFVVPLDDRREWYRYHHLFADVLRLRLTREDPADVRELHARASRWFEAHDGRPAAFLHAVAAGDFERAADLAELELTSFGQGRQETTLRNWMEALPPEVLARRPVLNLGYVGALMAIGDFAGVEPRLDHIQAQLDQRDDTIVVDQAQYERIPAQVAVYRAGLARLRGDVSGTLTFARQARELVQSDDNLGRGAASGLLALAYWSEGDLDAAHRWYSDARDSLDHGGYAPDVIGCTLALADIRVAQGRLRDAMATLERGEALSREHGGLRGATDMHIGMSELWLEHDDLDAALAQLETARKLGDAAGLPQYPYRSRVAMALVRAAQGDTGTALDLLDEAEACFTSDYFPTVRPIAALRARVQLEAGDVRAARGWADGQNVRATDELRYLREYEHITLARVLLAEGAYTDAAPFLQRLLAAAETGGRLGSTIEILLLQAQLHDARRDAVVARAARQRARTLAEPEGFVRLFAGTSDGPTARPAGASPGLVDPLSERELAVLRLLRSELSGPDIARELTVSLNTMRTHTKNIYAKLGVNSRRAAVRRADELGL
jgi:LuxR family maltose regulon positive regulatory protein